MKRLILILFLLPFTLMGQTLIDSYPVANWVDYSISLYSTSNLAYSQSFTNTNSITLSSCVFYVRKYYTPTGNCYACVYAHSGTYGTSSVPTGAALATSNAIDVSTLPTIFTLTEFTFSGANKITLSASTKYCVVIEYTGGNSTSRIAAGGNNTTNNHSGNTARWITDWSARSSDLIFYVYGDAAATSTASPFQQVNY